MGWLSCEDIDGSFFWGWQLVRSYSPKYSSLRQVCPKDAGEYYVVGFLVHLSYYHSRIVEFASQEDSQRSIRELSEMPLLGRPVFIREVGRVVIFVWDCPIIMLSRIVRTSLDSVRLQCPEKLGWQWLDKD